MNQDFVNLHFNSLKKLILGEGDEIYPKIF